MGYYGQLNTPLSKPNYAGSTTDSLIIKVDNDKMIISGDVIWGDMLGTAPCKAYPGNLGNENYENIVKLTAALNQEINRALQTEETLTEKVDTGVIRAQEYAEQAVETANAETTRALAAEDILRRTILNEVSKLIDSEAELLSKINSETEARTTEDQLIKDQLNYILNNISSGVSGIDLLLKAETQRAQEAEKLLNEKIEEEKLRALNSESKLKDEFTVAIETTNSNLDELKSHLIEEIENTEGQINLLKIDLSQEIERSGNKDKEHDDLISAQSTEIKNLGTQIANIESITSTQDEAINKLSTDVKTNTDAIIVLNDTDSMMQDRISTLFTSLSEEVDRAQLEEIKLKTNIDSLESISNSNANGIINLNSRVGDLETSSEEQLGKITTLFSSIDELKSKDEEFIEALNNLNEKVEDIDLTSITDKYDSEIDKLSENIESNTQAINNVASRVFDLETLTEDHNQALESLKDLTASDIENLQKQNNTIETLLNNEIERSTSRDDEIDNKINSEIKDLNDRTYALEQSLPNNVQVLKDKNQEILDYINGDFKTELQGYDSLIQADLTSETQRAQEAEATLQSNINAVSDTFKGPYVTSKPAEGGKILAYTVFGGNDGQIEIDNEVKPNTLVRRGDNGQITLPRVFDDDDFELFSDTDAIPKSYVHVVEDDIRSYIDSEIARVYRIDFIDGGTTSQL